MKLLEAKPPPKKPGVYQFKNSDGQIIYIGKAKNLRSRVKSYFAVQPKDDFKTINLVKKISDVEYVITDNELEALILENTLIKRHKPKYNIRLRDDKNYQFIKIDYTKPIAKIYSVRQKDHRASRKQARWFGPFTSGLNVRNTIRLTKRIFPYCEAEKVSHRPCFNYQLHRCPGVCVGLVSPEEYGKSLAQVELFLQGKNDQVRKSLILAMAKASRKKQYEKAAALRDQLTALDALSEKQKVISAQKVDQDFVSLERSGSKAAVNLFVVRNGRLLNKENMLLENVAGQASAEILAVFMERYYAEAESLPKEIFLPVMPVDKELLEELINKRYQENTGRSRKIRLKIPLRGPSQKLLRLGQENAKNYLDSQLARFEKEEVVIADGLKALKKILALKQIPRRIECFDISNIQGKSAVGSMVVFTEGRPRKDQYRKFKIKTKSTPDDYTMMREVLERRLNNDWPKPDLLVMDGGQGQLAAAIAVLKKQKITIPVIALGKSRSEPKQTREEKVFLPNRQQGLVLGEGHPGLTILQRLRDEAHRFAITYHRKVRSQTMFN